MDEELVTETITLTKEVHERITELGAQCGLTPDQMASAIFVLSANRSGPAKIEPA